MNPSDVLFSWGQVKDTEFGKWLIHETEKARMEAVEQSMAFDELAPLLKVQGFRTGVQHWSVQLAEMQRVLELDEKKRKKGFLERVGLGG